MLHKESLDFANEFSVNAGGGINNPGKFEAEPLYVPYFWNMAMNGCGEDYTHEDGTHITVLEIDATDKENFIDLVGFSRIELWESSQGFVFHNLL